MVDLNLADRMTTDTTPGSADECFELGMIHASGRDGSVDMVTAHKWFNIAASRGPGEAAAQRREVATQMTDSEIGTAQRAARDWLMTHPIAAGVAAAPVLRIAA
jgi:TPR repeat protein